MDLGHWEGIGQSRIVVQEIIKELDPEGTELHKSCSFKRGQHHNSGPKYA